MSITLKLDLPEELLNEARANGLLESRSMGELLRAELRRRKSAGELNKVLYDIRAQPGTPMSESAIQKVIKAARRGRRGRETGR